MEVIVDSREPKKLKTKITKKYGKDHNIKVEMLPEGDYLSKTVICERKTVSDLYGSIIDKRIWSQVNRMSTYESKTKILLVTGSLKSFEGMLRRKKKFLNRKTIYNALASIGKNYQFEIYWIEDEDDAIEFLFGYMEKSDAGSAKKPMRADPDVLLARLLGLSLAIYKDLFKEFGSIKNISNASKKDLMKVKGIGDKRAEQIIKIFEG